MGKLPLEPRHPSTFQRLSPRGPYFADLMLKKCCQFSGKAQHPEVILAMSMITRPLPTNAQNRRSKTVSMKCIDPSSQARLYHYQSYTPATRDRLEETLRSRTIYLSSPAAFNDPWDCRPWFDLEALEDPKIRDQTIDWFMKIGIRTKAADAHEMRQKPSLLRSIVEQCAEGIWNDIDEKYRVYCLTPKDDDLLMWSHYADSHRGICLQFDTHPYPICSAFEVSYNDTLPVSHISESSEDFGFKALLVKAIAWKYENEFRVIALDASRQVKDLPVTQNNRLHIGDDSLVGIIVGCQCPYADEIIDIVGRYQPSVKVIQAKRHPHRYGIGYETRYPGR
ncbi:DUF2971 domain-containing protein [Herbaspirillum sp. ST 5-3]|uniref:DUF2971 domain-containing protein n=1 Tax=Oxalobacteraceae TaxID=75682 RepID=UPI001455E64B|nr:DUF2971 domain-containing protein [Herbaspirillum sp. ST 5-3]